METTNQTGETEARSWMKENGQNQRNAAEVGPKNSGGLDANQDRSKRRHQRKKLGLPRGSEREVERSLHWRKRHNTKDDGAT